MENDPFIDDVPIKMVIVHGYVKQPKGNYCVECCWHWAIFYNPTMISKSFFLHARIIG